MAYEHRRYMMLRPDGTVFSEVKNAIDLAVAEDVADTGTATGASLSGTFAPLRPARLSPLVGVLGDSLSVNMDTATKRGSSPLHYAALRSSGKIQYTYMGGVSGETSTAIAARATDFIATGAKTIVILMGANDVTGTGPFDTVTRPNLDATIDAVIRGGGTPVLATLPPKGTVSAPPTLAQQQFVNTYNLYVRRKSAILGTPLVDYFSALVDPANNYYHASVAGDGTHPNASGWSVMGNVLKDALVTMLPQTAVVLPAVNADTSSLTNNCLMLNNAAGLATGWTVATGGVTGITPTVAAITSARGNKQVLTASSSSALYALWRNGIVVTAGDVLRIVGVTSWSGFLPRIYLNTTSSGVTSYYALAPVWDTLAAVTDGVINYEFTVPTGVDHIDVGIAVPAGSTGFIELSQFAIYNLTAQDAL